MTPQQLIRHFGGNLANAALSIGVARRTLYNWLDAGFIPIKQQLWIERETGGKLKADKK